MDLVELLRQIAQLIHKLNILNDYFNTLFHPNLLIKSALEDTIGLVLSFWNNLLLHTSDFPAGSPFTGNATILTFEPTVQKVADGGLVLVAIWASYRIMWSHGVRTNLTARVLLPRLFLAAALINFALPLVQMAVDATNAADDAVQSFQTFPVDWTVYIRSFLALETGTGWQIISTTALVFGYVVLGIAYLVRYTLLVVLAITAPLASLLYALPDTQHWAKLWGNLFLTNLLMQPAQLFVLAVGFGLDAHGHTPIDHLFALVALLIAFKVPGAMHATAKIASKFETAMHHELTVAARLLAHA